MSTANGMTTTKSGRQILRSSGLTMNDFTARDVEWLMHDNAVLRSELRAALEKIDRIEHPERYRPVPVDTPPHKQEYAVTVRRSSDMEPKP